MKTQTTPIITRLFIPILAVICLCLWTNHAKAATSLYFDSNGTAAGYGSGGNWDGLNWATSSGGTASTANSWAANDFARFYGIASSPATVTVGASEANVGLFLNVDGVSLIITATNASGNLSISTNSGLLLNGGFVQGFLIGATTTAGTASLSLLCPVIGAGGIDQQQSGSLYLYGTNTYSGGTDLTGGQNTYYNNNSSFGTGTIGITGSGQALISGASIALNIHNNIIFAASGYNLNLAGGPAVAGSPGTTFSGNITLLSGPTTLFTSSSATTVDQISGNITGSGAQLIVEDLGELILSGANTYSGGTLLGGGTLDAKSTGSIPGAITVTNGTLIIDASIPGNITLTGGSVIGNQPIPGNLAVSGGNATLNQTISGNVTITGGNVQLTTNTAIAFFSTLNLPAASTNLVNLNFAGTNTILALNFGGTSMPIGTYGAAGSGATYTNSAFTGGGILSVAISSGTNYFWDANGSDATSGHSDQGGGSGNWDNVTPKWWVSGTSDTAWQGYYAANFGGTAGTVTVADNVAPGSMNFTTAGYLLTNNGSFSIYVTNTTTLVGIPAGTTTIGVPISGQGILVSGPGTLVLSGANTYTAGTVVTNGATVTVNAISDSGTSGLSTAPVTLANGTLNYTGTSAATTTRHFQEVAGTTNGINLPAGNLTLNSQINGTAGFVFNKTGSGTLTLGGNIDNAFLGLNLLAGEVILNKGTPGHALGGPVNVSSGTLLQLSGAGYGSEIYSGATAPVSIYSGGQFDLNGQSNTLTSLALAGNGISGGGVIVNSAAGTSSALTTPITLVANTTIGGLSPTASPGNIALIGVISGNPTLTQASTNNLLTLSGASTFYGGLILNPSTTVMLAGSSTPAGNGPISLGANSTLLVNIGANTIPNPIVGNSTTSIDVITNANGNTGFSGDLLGFTGQLNCPASLSTAKVQFTTSESFEINPAATINVSNGATLYVANHNVVVPCTINMLGTGNGEAYGALRLESGALINGPVKLYGNTTMGNGQSAAANFATISGVISSIGSYGITFTAEPGVIQLFGANTYTGPTVLTGGVVQLDSAENAGVNGPLGNSAAANPGSITLNGGLLQFTSLNHNDYSGRFSTAGGQKFYFDINGQTVNVGTPLSGVLSGLGLQSTAGGGTLVMNAQNTYTSNSIIASGTLVLNTAENPGSSGPLGNSSAVVTPAGSPLGSIVMSGGKLQFTSANQFDYSGRFSTNNSQSFNLDVNGQNVAFANALWSSGGSLTLSSTAGGGSLTLNGTNLYTGATTISPGTTLNISGAGDLANTASGSGVYTAAITDEGTFNFGSSTNQILTGAITGIGSLIKSGTGTLILSNAANAYFGGTVVSNGTLVIYTNGASIAGNVAVAGGVLALSNSAALAPNAVLSLPAAPAAGTVVLNFSGVQTISGLVIGTNSMAPGTYGGTGSGAMNTSATFAGLGILNVAGQAAFWDPSALNGSPGSGGNGNWDNTTSDWWVNGSADSVWAGTNTAYFAGTAGTVSLNTPVSASGLYFTVPNYVISGSSSLTLLSSTNYGTPIISIPAGNTTINSPLASGVISNSQVIVNGPGTLTLSGDNSGITNNLEVTGGGTLSVNTFADSSPSAVGIGTNLALFDANLAFTGSSGLSTRHITLSGPYSNTISVLPGNTLELDGGVQNAGSAPQELAFTGGGTLILGGAADNSSLYLAILAGKVELNKANLGSGHGLGGGTSIVSSGATLQLVGSGAQLYSGAILTVNNGGVFDLNGQAQFATSTLNISGTGIGGTGALINSSGSPAYITNSAGNQVVLTGNTTIGGVGSITEANVISGVGYSLTYNGTSGAQLFLDGANTFSGGLNVAAGSTVVLNALAGAGTGPITLQSGGGGGPGSGGSLILPTIGNGYGSSYFNPVTGDSTTTISITGVGTGNVFIQYNLTNFSGTINCGNGGNSVPQILLTAVNNEAYPISPNATWNIASGTTVDFQAPCTVDPAKVIINGIGNNIYGCLRLDACNQTGPVVLNAPGAMCQIGDGNTPVGASTISGVISDNGYGYGFTKVGAATGNNIILTAVNTYSGPTIVSNGVLSLAGSGSIATSSGLTLMGSTTFDVTGLNSGSYTLGSGEVFNCYGTATVAGNLNINGAVPISLQTTNIGTALFITNGTLTLNNNPITVTVYNGGSPISPTVGTYPLIADLSSITGTGPGLVGGSVSGSTLTVASLNPAFNASLVISNNALYMIIGVSAPTIISQLPASAGGPTTLLYAGANPNYSIQALGLAPLQYQWYTNGTLVGYAAGASLTLTNVQVGALSTYCIVSNTPTYTPAMSAIWTALVTNDPTPPFPALVLSDKAIGYWRLNEAEVGGGDNGVIAEDYLGNNDGVYTNVSLGNPGYSSATDPSETSVYMGNLFSDCDAFAIPNINFGASSGASRTFSIEAWVDGYQQTGDNGIVSLGFGGGGEQFNLDTGSDGFTGHPHAFRFFVRDASGATHSSLSSTTPSINSWHHLVGVCDEANGLVTLYVDGVIATSGSGAITPGSGILSSTRNMIIGSRPSAANTNNNFQFTGFINDVAVYNYALTPNQVVAHYVAAGVPPSFIQVPSSATITTNGGVTLSFPVTALGTPPLTLTWQDVNAGTNLLATSTNGDVILGTLTYSNIPASWNGDSLSLTVANSYGSTNILIPLFVNSTLTANQVPGDTAVTITAGQQFTWTAQATGTIPITYQWYLNDLSHPISNQTNASYAPVATLASSNYFCVVTDPSSSVTLPTVTVTGVPYLALGVYGEGWGVGQAVNQSGTFSTAAFNGGVLTLTDGGGSEVRSVFFDVPQYIGAFEAAFTYQAGGSKTADGIAFVLQNDARGVTAIGAGGGQLGVGTNTAVSPSAELELNLYTGSSEVRGYAFFTNGLVGAGGANGNYKSPGGATGVNLASGNPIDVLMYYSNGQLSLTLTDLVAQTTFSTNLNVGNLPTIVHGNTAYVGFTGASGGSTAVQTVSNFSFISLMNLTTQISGSSMTLSWPNDVSLYQLQSTTSLSSPNWVNVNNAVSTVGNQNQVTVSATGTQQFYRLVLQ